MLTDKLKRVEKILGITLPKTITQVDYYRWQPSPDLHYFQDYVKFAADKVHYDSLINQLGLQTNIGGATPYLPANWSTPAQIDLPWWNATEATPSNASAKAYGVNGWIVAKYEHGSVFIIVTDSGQESGSPGPW